MEVIAQIADILGPLGLLAAVLVYLLLQRKISNSGIDRKDHQTDREIHQKLFSEIKTLASTANHTQTEIKGELTHVNTRLDAIGNDLADLRKTMISHLEKHAH